MLCKKKFSKIQSPINNFVTFVCVGGIIITTAEGALEYVMQHDNPHIEVSQYMPIYESFSDSTSFSATNVP